MDLSISAFELQFCTIILKCKPVFLPAAPVHRSERGDWSDAYAEQRQPHYITTAIISLSLIIEAHATHDTPGMLSHEFFKVNI